MKLKEKCSCKSNEQRKREDHCSPFSMGELQQSINELNPDSAPGDDQITNSIIQHLPENAKEILLNLFNESIDKDYFPSTWKKATITPILKPGRDAKHFDSYRPICLTSCLGKVLERMVKNRLTHFLETKNILCPEQAGFRRMRSTQDQVMKITQEVADGLNHKPGKRTILALIDFSRAFDTVWHKGLLDKLIGYEIPTCMIHWIKSFLEDRKTKVRFENAESDYRGFKSGTP